ncbi:class I SAM-dependent methyltransferase [Virgibacillus oceani]|uniref:site-specific DNA-methyltransferase (adenine-specific) n=1 Tax=Virgibacillus oceani TaxID=1479511 RepID=A0A917HEM2_9BACI|nr:class I SAM-dependent methyltransferase [Virgibacillus oceani]GGG76656.1 DNA methyltransferase [Virgibacillus oceani]
MKLKDNATPEKIRGAYYTPSDLAQFLVEWGFNKNVETVLEPSCGDGVFLESLKGLDKNFSCIGVELFESEAEKAKQAVVNDERFKVINNDFYDEYEKHLTQAGFDLIVGNPPYIRYQYLTEEQREEQSIILQNNGMNSNKLINAWVSFVVASVQLLNNGGNIGLVIPAELLQVKYSEQLRLYLMEQLQKMTIVTFRELIFPDVEQEVILLMGEKVSEFNGDHLIKILEFDSIKDLVENFEEVDKNVAYKEVDLSTTKWTRYFLNQKQNEAIDEVRGDNRFFPFNTIADVDIGITTGNNKFFSVNKEIVKKYDLESVAIPLIARSVNIPGTIFRKEDWLKNVEAGANTYLLDFNGVKEEEFTEGQRNYIKEGEKRGEHTGYKCRIRKKWYCIPSIYTPDAFFLRRNHLYPKFVMNDIDAVSTDTMHRIRFSLLADRKKATLAFYNSIGLAFTELEARSYGGGVLEILPGELEKVTIPNLEDIDIKEELVEELLAEIDKLTRTNKDIIEVLNLIDEEILVKKMGISRDLVDTFNDIWKTLRSRRLSRG